MVRVGGFQVRHLLHTMFWVEMTARIYVMCADLVSFLVLFVEYRIFTRAGPFLRLHFSCFVFSLFWADRSAGILLECLYTTLVY